MDTAQQDYEARRAFEHTASQNRIATFQLTAAAIAAALSKLDATRWTFVAGEHENDVRPYGELVGQGLALHVSQFRDGYSAGAKDRIEITGSWPREKHGAYKRLSDYGVIPYNESEPRITVAVSNTPERIAKDIKRRLIDGEDLRTKYAKVVAAIAAGNAYDDRKEQLTTELHAIAGQPLPSKEDRRGRDHSIRLYEFAPGISYGDITATGDDTVKFDVTVNGALAKALLEFLAARRRKAEK